MISFGIIAIRYVGKFRVSNRVRMLLMFYLLIIINYLKLVKYYLSKLRPLKTEMLLYEISYQLKLFIWKL